MRRGIEVKITLSVTDTNSIKINYEVVSDTTSIRNLTIPDGKVIYNLSTVEKEITDDLESIKNQISKFYLERELAFRIAEKIAGTYKVNSHEIVKVDI